MKKHIRFASRKGGPEMKFHHRFALRLALAGVLGALNITAIAQAPAASAAAPSTALSDGEVRKVDLENKKLTLRHGPLANLDMPGMTMVFLVKHEAMLQRVQPGDKVRFAADKIDGKFTVIQLEPAP